MYINSDFTDNQYVELQQKLKYNKILNKEFLIDVGDGRKFAVKHYNLQVIIALGFKIDNERAVQFRKWANDMSDYDRYLLALEEEAKKTGGDK